MTDSPSEIVYIPYEPAYEAAFEDMARRRSDRSTIPRAIGYRPTLDLPSMLVWIIAYARIGLEQPALLLRLSDKNALAPVENRAR